MTGQGIRQHEYQSGKSGRRQSHGCSACWIRASSPVRPTTILREPLKRRPSGPRTSESGWTLTSGTIARADRSPSDLHAQDLLLLQRPDEILNEASQTVGDPLERDAGGGELTGDRAIARRLVVVSNRLGNIRDLSQAGGLAVGIGDALAERGGLWLGANAEYQDYAASDSAGGQLHYF